MTKYVIVQFYFASCDAESARIPKALVTALVLSLGPAWTKLVKFLALFDILVWFYLRAMV